MRSKVLKSIMNLWPSKRQWKSWSLPSKLTAISVPISLIGIVLALAIFLLDKGYQSSNVYLSQSDLTDTAEFDCTVFFHKSDGRPLDDHLRGDGGSRFGGRQFGGMLSQFISDQLKKNKSLDKEEFKNPPGNIIDFYHDMILIKLINHFFWMYSASWKANVYSIREGTVEIKTSSVDRNKEAPDHGCLTWGHLLNTEEQGDFYNLLSSFSDFTNTKEMRVPPNTTVTFIITGYKKGIVITNPFVKVTIALSKRSASSGLGDYKWLLGNELNSERFWSAHFRVNCIANFEGTKSADPDMAKYKQWVEVMFSEIQYLLDEREQLERAHEYLDSTKPS